MTAIAVLLTALVVSGLIGMAYSIGYHVGYWKRVQEEKSARGVW
jgi:hypothetical protein